jgi:hypothetical protein
MTPNRAAAGSIVVVLTLLALGLPPAGAAAGQAPAPPPPLVKENATVKLSDHVWAIPDFNVGLVPNVGIVVGS